MRVLGLRLECRTQKSGLTAEARNKDGIVALACGHSNCFMTRFEPATISSPFRYRSSYSRVFSAGAYQHQNAGKSIYPTRSKTST